MNTRRVVSRLTRRCLLATSLTLIAVNAYPSDGDYVWAKHMGGAGGGIACDVALDSLGNVITTGAFGGTVDFDPGPGVANLTSVVSSQSDIFVSKLDASGTYVWASQLGGAVDGDGRGLSLAVDASDNLIVCGYFSGTMDFDPGPNVLHRTAAGSFDIFVLKLDSSGMLIWVRQMGGTGDDRARSVALDSSGNVYTTGYFSDTVDFDPGASTANFSAVGVNDVFLSKLNSSGEFLWIRQLGGASTDPFADRADAVAVDSSGNAYTTGYFSGTVDFDPGPSVFNIASAGDTDMFVWKLDSSGVFEWAKQLGGSGGNIGGSSVAVDSNGRVLTTGPFVGTVDFDPGPGVTALTAAGGIDVFVSKLDSAGAFEWAKRLGGIGASAEGVSVSVDSEGNVYTTGMFSDTVDFDPGPGEVYLTSMSSDRDVFGSKLDSAGNFVWAKQMGGFGAYAFLSFSVALDVSSNVYFAGTFSGTVDFDPGPNTSPITSFGSGDVFVAKLSGPPPLVTSITFDGIAGTMAAFTVAFNQCVDGVDISDFALTTTGTISGASILSVIGSCDTYTVTVDVGLGSGILRLDLLDDDTIINDTSQPLGGTGAGNGDFTSGQSYAMAGVPLRPWPIVTALLALGIWSLFRLRRGSC